MTYPREGQTFGPQDLDPDEQERMALNDRTPLPGERFPAFLIKSNTVLWVNQEHIDSFRASGVLHAMHDVWSEQLLAKQ